MQMRAVCLDISSDACHLTQENAERLSLADRLEVYQADVCLDKGFSSSHIRFFAWVEGWEINKSQVWLSSILSANHFFFNDWLVHYKVWKPAVYMNNYSICKVQGLEH